METEYGDRGGQCEVVIVDPGQRQRSGVSGGRVTVSCMVFLSDLGADVGAEAVGDAYWDDDAEDDRAEENTGARLNVGFVVDEGAARLQAVTPMPSRMKAPSRTLVSLLNGLKR